MIHLYSSSCRTGMLVSKNWIDRQQQYDPGGSVIASAGLVAKSALCRR